MSNKEECINSKKMISSICISKDYELLGGCDMVQECLFNLHTSNAIYTHFGLTSTEEYRVSHRKLRKKYSEEDTEKKKKLIEELELDKLETKFTVFERELRDVKDTSFQKCIEYLPEEYKNQEKEAYKKLIEKKIVKDSSAISIRYTNGEFIQVSLEYLSKDYIEKFSNIINNNQEKYEKVSDAEIIKAPLLKFEKKHDVEIEYLKKIKTAYNNLNFDEIYDLLDANCFKKSISKKDKYNIIIGKKEIIENYQNLVNIASQNNLMYQGCIYGEITDENEPILAIHFKGSEKNDNSSRKRIFSLSIRINDDNLISEINIRDEEQYAGKYLDSESLEKIKIGAYSDFS